MPREKTSLSCSKDTLAQIRGLKRGGETYDELLRKMAQQYSPEQSCR